MARNSTDADTDFSKAALEKAVRNTVAAICERFGKGATTAWSGDPGEQPRCGAIPTGTLNLSDAPGSAGLPLGGIVEIYGPESSDKATLTLRLIAEAQRRGLVCAVICADHALDMQAVRSLGVNPSELLVSQPDHGEQALEIADSLARTGAVGLIVVDSLAALISKAELEGEMGEHHVGLQARLMSQAMRKLSGAAAQTNTLIVFINQLTGAGFGSSAITNGCSALVYYASVRLDIRRFATPVDSDKASARVRAAR